MAAASAFPPPLAARKGDRGGGDERRGNHRCRSDRQRSATADARYDSITMAAVRITTHTTPSTMNSLAPNFSQVV